MRHRLYQKDALGGGDHAGRLPELARRLDADVPGYAEARRSVTGWLDGQQASQKPPR